MNNTEQMKNIRIMLNALMNSANSDMKIINKELCMAKGIAQLSELQEKKAYCKGKIEVLELITKHFTEK